MINRDQLITSLCSNPIPAQKDYNIVILFALYIIVYSTSSLPDPVSRLLQQKLKMLEQQPLSKLEEHLFIKAIRQRIGIEVIKSLPAPTTMQVAPDVRAIALNALKDRSAIGSAEVQEIIAACLDTRKLSNDVAKEITGNTWEYKVGEIAWPLLTQTWRMSPGTWSNVVPLLNDEQAITCAAAARLLRQGKDVPQAERAEAMESIRKILADETLSRRPLDAPDGSILRLDDELYDTLRILAE